MRLLLAGGNLEKVSSEKLKEELLDIPELRERMMLIVPHPCRWSCRGGAELFRFQPSAVQPPQPCTQVPETSVDLQRSSNADHLSLLLM